MRSLFILAAGALVASCTMAPPPPQPLLAQPNPELQRLIAGKVARPPISCIPYYAGRDMRVIDGRTLAFRAGGGSTVYIAHLTPGCEELGGAAYALLSRNMGSSGMCQGDMQQVLNTMSQMTVGSCAITDIVPFVRP